MEIYEENNPKLFCTTEETQMGWEEGGPRRNPEMYNVIEERGGDTRDIQLFLFLQTSGSTVCSAEEPKAESQYCSDLQRETMLF